MVTAYEQIDFSQWTATEQQQALNELVAILGNPATNYSALSDTDLEAAAKAIFDEAKTRPTAIVAVVDSVQFGAGTLFSVRP